MWLYVSLVLKALKLTEITDIAVADYGSWPSGMGQGEVHEGAFERDPPTLGGGDSRMLTCSLLMSSGASPSTIGVPLPLPFFPLFLGAFVCRREDSVRLG